MRNKKLKVLALMVLVCGSVLGQEYLKTDGTNVMSGALRIRRDGYTSIELESNTGAFIDFKNIIDNDYNGRIIWNFNNSNRFDIYGNVHFKNHLTFQQGLSGNYLKVHNEIQIPSNFSVSDPSIGLIDNSGFGVNIHKTLGIGFSLNNSHKMVILPNGYVGIGINSPSSKLQITNNLKNDIGLAVDKSFSGGGEGIPVAKFNFTDANITSSGVDIGTKTAGGKFELFNAYYNSISYFKIQQDGTTTIKGKLNCQEVEVKNIAATTLNLAGDLAANNITVAANGQTADFVFSEDYQLRDLSQVESFILTNKHLPDIPSAAEMEEQGVNLAEMNKLLLQKVEELMLYAIERQRETEHLKKESKELNKRLARLEILLLETKNN